LGFAESLFHFTPRWIEGSISIYRLRLKKLISAMRSLDPVTALVKRSEVPSENHFHIVAS